MVVDIDSFLTKFEEEAKTQSDIVSLDFQKDVEDKISNIQKNLKNKDISFLKEIYETIKKFDEDLPNKFLDIENKSGLALENLGSRYSKDFLSINKKNAKVIADRIKVNILKIDKYLESKNYIELLLILKESKNDLLSFPKTLAVEKNKLSNYLKQKEIEIYNSLEEYRRKETIDTKKRLNNIIYELKTNFSVKNGYGIEKNVNEIKLILNNIPRVISSHFTQEKIKINKILIVAQNFLMTHYDKDYEYRVKVINKLIEKFHANMIKKKTKTCILIYNEVLLEFNKLPDIFLERKIEMYNKINKLFVHLNNLLIKDNIDMFLEGYNHSKKVEAAREYLRHIEESKSLNPDVIKLLKKELKELPENFTLTKKELDERIDELTDKIYRKGINEDKKVDNVNLLPNSDIANYENVNNSLKNVLNKIPETIVRTEEPDRQIKSKKSHKVSNQQSKIHGNILKEIDVYYNRLKQSDDNEEIIKLYKKILFYLKLIKIDKNRKMLIVDKMKKVLNEKNIPNVK